MKIWTYFTIFFKLILFRNIKGCFKHSPVLHGSLPLGKLVTEEIQDGSTGCDSSIVTLVLYICFGDDDKDFFSVWKDQESEWTPISTAISVGNAVPIRYSWRRGKLHWVKYTFPCHFMLYFSLFYGRIAFPHSHPFLLSFSSKMKNLHALTSCTVKQVFLEYLWFRKFFS